MTLRTMPQPELVTCDTTYGASYCWKIEAHGLCILGDTRLECGVGFLTAYADEYGRDF